MKPVRFLLILVALMMLSACDPLMVHDQFMDVENGSWTWDQTGVFEMEMEDSTSLHNVFLQVRHSTEYPMSNLYMFVVLKGPTGRFVRDTVNLQLAAPDGRWLGRGTGKLREIHYLYRRNIRFNEAGTYTLSIEQGMRKSPLPVTNVGVRVERSNP
jgi:gliding motility-associated lipoprotein GldH